VHRWHVTFDPKSDAPVYTVSPGFGHALLAPIVANTFQILRVSATLWEHGQEWFAIHSAPSVITFEIEHGVEGRGAYDGRCLRRVLRERKTVLGEHGGYCDLFVPVVVKGDVEAVLVTGPFLRRRSTSAEILERWRRLTGRQGHPADGEFASFFAATQQILVLDGDQVSAFVELVECLSTLLAGEGDAGALTNRAQRLRSKVQRARFVEAMWEAVRTIVDERSSRTWFSVHRAVELRRLGLTRLADHVLVGLSKGLASGDDPVDEAVRRDGLQRSAVELAREMGDTLAGQIGDHGVVFLSAASGSTAKKRQKLFEIAAQLSRVARKSFGFSVHFGASPAPGSAPLPQSYQLALGAAEGALSRGDKIAFADPNASSPAASLRQLRASLGRAAQEEPDALAARFDRYLEVVTVQCGHRIEPARTHLEVGFERIAEPLIVSGAVDQRTLDALQATLDRAATAARSLGDLLSAYRRAVADLSEAVRRPVPARRDRSLRLALEYIGQHYTERLPLGRVARFTGFAPSHFSKLFIRRERMPFERYVRALRLERAKHLLISSDLDATRVAELSGFSSVQYFCHVFRAAVGTTPVAYRKLPKGVGPLRNKNANGNALNRNRSRRAAR
jgi:AraC-like DNA-binding protein